MKNLVTQAEAGSPTRESGEIRERPIQFTGPMVRAILDGRKTQTRRLVKPPAGWGEKYPICKPEGMADPWAVWWHGEETDRVGVSQDCLNGKPGDRLWVRETWTFVNMSSELGEVCVAYNADGPDLPTRVSIKVAESEITRLWEVRDIWSHRKRSSMFMPRWASRITLEITGVRVERLQEISEADARAEGCMPQLVDPTGLEGDEKALAEVLSEGWLTAKCDYMFVWDSINKKAPWSTNPWVWVIEFKRVEAAGGRNG